MSRHTTTLLNKAIHRIRRFEEENTFLRESASNAEDRNDELQKENADLKDDIEALESSNRALDDQLFSWDKEIKELKAKNLRTGDHLTSSREDCAKRDYTIKWINELLSSGDKECAKLKEENTSLKDRLQKSYDMQNESYDSYATKVVELKEENAQINIRLIKRVAECGEKDIRFASLACCVTLHENEINKQDKEIEELKGKLQRSYECNCFSARTVELEEIIALRDAQITGLRKRIEECNEVNGNIRQECWTSHFSKEKLASEIESLRSDKETYKNKAIKLVNRNDELCTQVTNRDTTIKELKARFKENGSLTGDYWTDLQEKIKELKAEIQRLKEVIRKHRCVISDTSRDYRIVRQENLDLLAKVELLTWKVKGYEDVDEKLSMHFLSKKCIISIK